MGRGSQVFFEIDPIVGLQHSFMLSRGLTTHLHHRNLVVLKQAYAANVDLDPRWISSEDLCLHGDLAREWDIYIHHLYMAGVVLTKYSDQLVWSVNKTNGVVLAKLAYASLFKQRWEQNSC